MFLSDFLGLSILKDTWGKKAQIILKSSPIYIKYAIVLYWFKMTLTILEHILKVFLIATYFL